ncbi:MAG TPA: NAD(P)/FAD-dependent oxidoreductase [Pseudonocardia sp.]|jgi:FAD-dependent urate hydroxylase|nr:NAD(P)/FAD-dependent oxidoreductase [Pseudonocardia sp.]
MKTAVVIGAGVAGPVVAMALQKAGVHAEVFEAHPTGADEVGSWLTLQANGIDALRAVDAHKLVAELGYPTRSMRFLNGKGKVLGRMSNGPVLPDGTGSQMLRRSDLYTGLRDEAVARGASVQYGKRLVEARSDGRRVAVTFADGTTAEGDYLIGCDGIRSRVREIIDPEAAPVRYVPVLNIGGYIADFPLDTPPDEFQMMFGTRCFFGWTATPDGSAGWFANPPHPREPAPGELEAMSDADWRTWLLELLGDDYGPMREMIAAAPGPLTGWATFDMPRVRRWYRDNMIIIGDAAHATSPAAGQGAAMALEDAVVLAQCLRDVPEHAFPTFEGLRRVRVERVVKAGARSSNAKAAGPVGRVVRDALLPVIFRRAGKSMDSSLTWMHGHHIEWDAAVTR